MKRRTFLKQGALAAAGFSLLPDAIFPKDQKKLESRGTAKKVIVIGAGLAGLSAAYELTKAGHDVTVLEAQTRAGGRVLTLRSPFSDGLYAEHGAISIPDTHDITLRYVKEFDLPLEADTATPELGYVYHVRGKRVVWPGGIRTQTLFKLAPEDQPLRTYEIWKKYRPESIFQELGNPADPNWSVDALKKYDSVSYGDLLRSRGASAETIAFLTYGWGDLWGEGAANVSALMMLRDNLHLMKSEKDYVIKGGNDLLPKAFATSLAEKIRYGSPVVKIEHNDRLVRATYLQAGTHHSIEADRLVIAIPFSVLRRIEISPRFTAGKMKAINELPYFSGARVSLQSRKRFWIAAKLKGSGLTDLPIATISDMTSEQPGSRGILQAYLGGSNARKLTALKETDRVAFVLEQTEKLFPGIKENFEGGVSKCWDEDEWARGASSWYKPGQMGELWPHIARAEGRVHFAGDHTSAWIRWMQGALHSGNRVAKEVNDA